ncbi:LppU/SCO3897 family protein [Actinoplanes aureus]|uniref:Uncharacterized protein n=1 Tax=Actinoplanes aureus TaxID=2792083 RepID=A0A931FVB5_9ACTN|nr:hypothetical protein [Actinoplanes aureus]MBG0560622.1 hypothetical protein [Actinoplanes aureus]
MSQNGPYSGQPWPGGSPDEPYAEPSDPWRGQEQPWSPSPPPPQIPQQPRYTPTPKPEVRRGFAMGALIAFLSVLVGGGLATTAWFLLGREDDASTVTTAPSTVPANGPRPQTSEDARFAVKGQCVRNEGTNAEPKLRIVICAANTYQVLKRIDGRTTGDKDAMGKCAKVTGYTNWYYYDTEYDDVDFVLCLKEYGPV